MLFKTSTLFLDYGGGGGAPLFMSTAHSVSTTSLGELLALFTKTQLRK